MKHRFTFIDLFAGIGGFHLAMHRLGGTCVFASEIDKDARKTYEYNFKNISPELFSNGLFNDDIRNIMPNDIPDFDVLCAGFPCQPFSQAGYKRGFDDNHKSERGNLFFNVADIIQEKQPKAFFLENVRGLVNHDSGRTFKTIRDILETELGYSFYYKIVQACDYGLPQLRPRVFIVGFKHETLLRGFNFPQAIPLKFTMSDVFQGICNRDIGFTLRVGGRGSKIDDRRNWEFYQVNNEIRRIKSKEAKRIQGFPDTFHFPVSEIAAMKQLGNSVAVDAIEAVGKNVIAYMNSLKPETTMKSTTHNKGEWSELLLFVKLLAEQQLFLSDENLEPTQNFFNLHKVSTKNLDLEFFILNKSTLEITNKKTGKKRLINISKLLNAEILNRITDEIKQHQGTFNVASFSIIQHELGLNVVKGGNSTQKSDILLDISNSEINRKDEGFGIKSYLGAKPTLLNASGNTNFIFKIDHLSPDKLDEINAIDSATKLRDRIIAIEQQGGVFKYMGAEKETMTHNLKMVDSLMPVIIGHVLYAFYKHRISSISKIVDFINEQGELNQQIQYGDKAVLKNKLQKLLVDVLLGFFAGSKWDGNYDANGTIVMKQTGDCVAFHLIELKNLREYLYQHIKMDTPSTTRHRYGKLFVEADGQLYFKLNLQLRF